MHRGGTAKRIFDYVEKRQEIVATNLMKMGATPLSGVLSCVAIEDSEEALPPDTSIVDNERMGIFHVASCAHILGDTNLVGSISCRVLIQNLGVHLSVTVVQIQDIRGTYTKSVDAICSCN